MRQSFLYNNLMFAGVGYMIELQSGRTWEQFVRERILQPLDMKSTGYTIAEMVKAPEHGVGFTEKRDSFDLYKIPYTRTSRASRRAARSSRTFRISRTGS